jgi:hypothetical protein
MVFSRVESLSSVASRALSLVELSSRGRVAALFRRLVDTDSGTSLVGSSGVVGVTTP